MKRFVVIGYGHIGKRHAYTIQQNPRAELVAVVDPKDVDADVPHYRSLEQLIESGMEVDVACICTPNGLHSDQAITCLNVGWNVLIEKPMGLSAQKCEEVIAAGRSNNKRAFCVMQNRYSPPSQWLKSLVTENVLGEVYMVDVKCFWNRDARYYQQDEQAWRGSLALDGGTLFTQFSHFVDLIYWLFGEVKDVEAQFMDYNHADLTEFEDSGRVTFRLGERTSGSLTYSTAVANKNFESSISILAEKGSVKVGGQYMNRVEYCDIENYELPELPPSNPANHYGAYQGSANNHPLVIQNVIDVLEGRATETTPAEEGKAVVEIIERIYKHRAT